MTSKYGKLGLLLVVFSISWPSSARRQVSRKRSRPAVQTSSPIRVRAPVDADGESCQRFLKSRKSQVKAMQGPRQFAMNPDLEWMCEDPKNFCIFRDWGGYVEEFKAFSHDLREAHCNVVILGECNSSCSTYLLAALPPGRVCASPKAKLGFHEAYFDPEWTRGVKTLVPGGTQALLDSFHEDQGRLKEWFIAHRSVEMQYLRGREMAERVNTCPSFTSALPTQPNPTYATEPPVAAR